MNILHIVYAKVWGGGEQYVYNFCREEKRLGHKNLVILDPAQKEVLGRLQDVADLKYAPLRGAGRLWAWQKILQVIDEEKVDILNCHSGTMSALCAWIKTLRPNVKFVQYRHNVTPNKKDLYHRWLQNKADAFVCVSKLVYDLQTATALPKNIQKFHLVYNGIDATRFVYRQGYLPGKCLKIGYAGRMVENKGVLVLLEAAKILKEKYHQPLELILAGDAEPAFLKKCKDFVQNNGLAEEWKYLLFVVDMPSFYKELDIFVLPSIARESFGFVLCEAMYSGVPVVSTDSGAQGKIVQDGKSGFLVPVQNAEILAEKLLYLARHPQEYADMARQAHERVQSHFTLSVMIEKINRLFAYLLSQ